MNHNSRNTILKLARLLLVAGVLFGYSQQIFCQFEIRHSPSCKHDHDHHHHGHDHDHDDHDEEPAPENSPAGSFGDDCSCKAPVVAFATLDSPESHDEPVLRITAAPETTPSPPLGRSPSALDHPPRA
ncbi:MAG: hypothetical protein HKN23_06315 [Verrucomicrobiales bacterium]|nr:hypothetical protein [Verrucomicrobiales bacterium]